MERLHRINLYLAECNIHHISGSKSSANHLEPPGGTSSMAAPTNVLEMLDPQRIIYRELLEAITFLLFSDKMSPSILSPRLFSVSNSKRLFRSKANSLQAGRISSQLYKVVFSTVSPSLS